LLGRNKEVEKKYKNRWNVSKAKRLETLYPLTKGGTIASLRRGFGEFSRNPVV
jgi:hypothetical protein